MQTSPLRGPSHGPPAPRDADDYHGGDRHSSKWVHAVDRIEIKECHRRRWRHCRAPGGIAEGEVVRAPVVRHRRARAPQSERLLFGHLPDSNVTSRHYVEKPLERPDQAARLEVVAIENSE